MQVSTKNIYILWKKYKMSKNKEIHFFFKLTKMHLRPNNIQARNYILNPDNRQTCQNKYQVN